MRRFASVIIAPFVALAPAMLHAADTKELPTLLTLRGKQLLADDFSSRSLDGKWKTAKGKWEIKDGALHGFEVAADQHAASIRTDLAHTDAVYQFDFRLQNGKAIHLSINEAKGHVCRVTISPQGFVLRKDGSKKDAADKAVTLDSCKFTFEQGKTYTMVVEVLGAEMLARIDDKHFGFGSDPKLSSPKSNLGFPIAGEGSIDNLKVWEAQANPEWAKTKQKLTAEHPARMLAAPGRPASKKSLAPAAR